MTAPRISIIVCTHNRASYLDDCLTSISKQDCELPFEVIVVDNASTDETPKILAEWVLRDRRFHSIVEPRVGLSVAKNTGARNATGLLLLFTDDDVVLDTGWARVYADFFRRRPEELILAGGQIVPVPHDLGKWPAWFHVCGLADMGLLDHGAERPLGRHEYVWGASMAIPAGLFHRLGPWNESVGRQGIKRGTYEDTEYQDRLRASGGTIWFCPSAVLRHRFPRSDILPSRLFRTAFVRGRNQFWADVTARRDAGVFAPGHDYVRALAVLATRIARLAFWLVAFTLRPAPAPFCRAHAAATSAGRSVDVLRAGRENTRLSRAIGRVVFSILDGLLLLVRAGREREAELPSDAQPPVDGHATLREGV